VTTSRATTGEVARRLSTPIILLAGLLALTLLAAVRDDIVFERVITVMLINLVLVVGLQIFMGNSGLGSFGQYAFVTIGAYGSIWFSLTPQQKRVALPDMPRDWWLYEQHLPFWPSVLVGALIATVVGALIGIALVRLRGAAFMIATFAFLIVVNRVALQWSEVTRGSRTVIGIPKYTGLWTAFICAALAVVLAYAFKESSIGLKLRASREDEDAAASLGVDAPRIRWVAWVISVFFSGVGGALWAHFIQQFSPHNFYLAETFLIVSMLIIGGTGSVSGAVIGTVAVALASEQLRQIENWLNTQRTEGTWFGDLLPFQFVGFTEIVLAVAIILVLIIRPSGITGGRELSWPRRWSRRRQAMPSPADAPVKPS